MSNYKLRKQKLKEKYINDLKQLSYWEKVSKVIKSKDVKNIEKFSLTFPHYGLSSNLIGDDEFKIETIAHEFGYEIYDEKLLPNKSIYYFQRIFKIVNKY